MIAITPKPEPESFDTTVRQIGYAFLAHCPTPSSDDWRQHRYWKKASDDLYRTYGGICAYTAEWFSRTTTSPSIDHFLPKSVAPHLAYEWSNYRLTTQKANNNKANAVGIADPFCIASGWFLLDLPSCLVKAGMNLSPVNRRQVEHSINVLKLNSDDEYVQNRCNIIMEFVRGDISINFLWRRYPFIAHELTRQNVLDSLSSIFKTHV